MPNPGLSRERAEEVVSVVNQCLIEGFSLHGTPSATSEASKRLKIPRTTVWSSLRAAEQKYGLKPNINLYTGDELAHKLVNAIKSNACTLQELAEKTKASFGNILDEIEKLKKTGLNIVRHGDVFVIAGTTEPAFLGGPTLEITSEDDNTFLFGAIGDLHAGSKYCRWDVREDLYRRIGESGAKYVFDTGNWIDGEASFNRFDLDVHGLDEQVKHLAVNHPKVEGLHTYAVWGDDHEGWYVQREGIDVGRYAENVMREHGHAWTDLGFMEANVTLTNKNTGAKAHLAVVHPGGGSSYAISYVFQKIIESYDGGEKPNVALYGHYHKLIAGNVRNVWFVSTGTSQDQTPFMRKKRLEAHVGGALVKLEQDPESGAIIGMTPTLWKYYNKGFYSQRWSKHGDVVHAPRSIK